MEIHVKKGPLRINHIWFPENVNVTSQDSDVLFFHDVSSDFSEKIKSQFKKTELRIQYSAITDLTLDEETLFSKIKKNVRYEINRASKEKIPLIFKKDDISEHELLSCKDIYQEMYKEKGMKESFNMAFLRACIKKGAVALSYALDNEGNISVFHIYILGNHSSRFYYSASLFRKNKETASCVAEMNKALHWLDITSFKSLGFQILDWGGIHDPKKPNGIDQFKYSFGCVPSVAYNVFVPRTLLGKIGLLLLDQKNKKDK